VPLNFEPLGQFTHDPNPMLESSLVQIKAAVAAEKADFGVCFDGDADRCIFVDEKGRTVLCDLITALLAPVFLAKEPGATVVYDVRTSRVVPEEIAKAGGVPRRERVGHAFIKKAMDETKAVFAGEGSGHFYFKDNWYADSGALVFAHMLNVVSRRRTALSKLIRPLQRYANSGELNFHNDTQDQTIQRLAATYGRPELGGQVDTQDGLRIDFDDWWFNVRKSNTEPLLRLNLEAKTAALREEKLKELKEILGEPVQGH
jgi:phosphomannomutase